MSGGYRVSSRSNEEAVVSAVKIDAKEEVDASKDRPQTFEDIVPIMDEFEAKNDGGSDGDFMEFEAVDADD